MATKRNHSNCVYREVYKCNYARNVFQLKLQIINIGAWVTYLIRKLVNTRV